ncbi:mechanosensitive ion channel family protein [Candidatus Woesearchaeota archaeon]|nr:mechanosensitive ion channel family protein [Candidatus Woesearchaeota archaeon]
MKEIIFNWFGTLPYGNYLQNKYVFALLILVVFVLVAKLSLFVFEKFFQRWAKKTKTEVDDIIFERTKTPIFYLLLALGIKFAILSLEVNGIANQLINSLMAIVFVFIVARVVDVIIDVWGKSFAKRTKSTFDDILLPLFHKIVKVIFVVITILWVLKIWNIDIGPYLAGAGILGIVIGFALQDSLKNIIGGVTLVLDKTFEIGDKVKIESGEVGTIHDIGLRSTKLVTYDNEVIYIPNGYLANSRVQNYTRPSPKIRAHVNFGVEYGSDVTQVQKVVLGILEKDKEILSDPESTVQFLEMGDSALNFKAYFWVEKWGMAYSKKLEMTEAIYNALNKAKIGIPFPTRTVHLVK